MDSILTPEEIREATRIQNLWWADQRETRILSDVCCFECTSWFVKMTTEQKISFLREYYIPVFEGHFVGEQVADLLGIENLWDR